MVFCLEERVTNTRSLKELRLRFDAEGRKLKRDLVTSSATGATTELLEHTNRRVASK